MPVAWYESSLKVPWWPPRGNKRAIMRIMSWSSGGESQTGSTWLKSREKWGEHLSTLVNSVLVILILALTKSVDGMRGPQVRLCWRFWGALVVDTLSCAAAGTRNAFSGLSFRWQVHTADSELHRFGNPRFPGMHNSFLKFGPCMIQCKDQTWGLAYARHVFHPLVLSSWPCY